MRFARLFAVIAATACSNDPTAPLDRAFGLDVGQTVSVDDAELSIKFVRVTEDSRCPAGVQCIWGGNGQIEIEARDDGEIVKYALNTTEGAKEVAVGAYRIQLVSLDPTPAAGQNVATADYRATLKVLRSGLVCTREARPALAITVVDSLTGTTTGFTDLRLRAIDGVYADSVVFATPSLPFDGAIALAHERRGTYTVAVSASGYATWTKSGVVVTGDECHVTTVPLTARLVR